MMVSRGNLVGTVRSNGLHDDSFFRKNLVKTSKQVQSKNEWQAQKEDKK